MARRISSPVLVGRRVETGAFGVALDDARSGRPALLILGGEAGAGKTRLVSEFAVATRAIGGQAVMGSAPPLAGDVRLPLAAPSQALRSLVRSVDARELPTLLGPSLRELAMVLPELGTPGEPPSEEAPFAQLRLLESLTLALERFSWRDPPLLVALEDLHWADASTLDAISYACRNLVAAPILLVLTYRSDALRPGAALARLLAELDRLDFAERLELGPLDPTEVGLLVGAILGEDPARGVLSEIIRRSDGNPFLVEELVLAARAGEPGRIPPSLRLMVDSRITRLGPLGSQLVVFLALAGTALSTEALVLLSGRERAEVATALEELGDAALLATDTRRDAAVQLRHALVAEVVAASLSPAQRRATHRALADAFERWPDLVGPSELERATALASHLSLAGDDDRAIRALLVQAGAAERARSFGAAVEAYERVIGLLEPGSSVPATAGLDATERASVLERSAAAASLAGDPTTAVLRLKQAMALDALRDDKDTERQMRQALRLGRYLAQAGEVDEAVEVLRSAMLEPAGTAILRARLLTELARCLTVMGRHGEAIECAEAAAQEASGPDARRELARARSAQAVALVMAGRPAEARQALDEATRAAPATRERPSRLTPSLLPDVMRAYLDEALVMARSGEPADAIQKALAGAHAAANLGLDASWGHLLVATAALHSMRIGAWDQAASMLAGVLASGPGRAEPYIVAALLAARRGQWEEADHHASAVELGLRAGLAPGWLDMPLLVRAETACWRGHFGDAGAAVREALEGSLRRGDLEAGREAAAIGIRAEADAQRAGRPRDARLSAGQARDAATALWLRWLSIGVTGETEPSDARARAWVETGSAELSRAMDDPRPVAWERAAAAWEAALDPFMLAYARLRLGEAILAADGDRGLAAAHLRQALAAAERLGAQPLAGAIEDLARRGRLAAFRPEATRDPASGSRAHAEARHMGLSEREVEVLELLADGLSDREIADRLFVTIKTAGHHVSHILVKLDVRRRGEAAAVAHRIGLGQASG